MDPQDETGLLGYLLHLVIPAISTCLAHRFPFHYNFTLVNDLFSTN